MKYVLVLGLTVLAIILFAYFWLFSDNQLMRAVEQQATDSQSLPAAESADTATQPDMNGFGTMTDLRSRNTSLECQITPIENAVASEGTFFVAEGKMRGDFITQSPDLDGLAVTSFILVEQSLYVWTELDGESYGAKVNLAQAQENNLETQEPVGFDERVQYSCREWKMVDHSVFIPPTDVLFQDMSQILQEGMEYGTVYEEGEVLY